VTMHVVATAGHVDHGKSTLVKALTGTDPDRLAEERARGLTIDLGFASTSLGPERELAFVDVPGHVRFIKNMLAGVGAVDACLFVVAANEGWKPQSEEHLRILELLGVGHGLVALTKVGALDDEWRALAKMELADRVAGTFLEPAEVVEVDAPLGFGLDQLREGLGRLLAETPTAADRERPRLWVDRSFVAKGSGTVVTGTLTGGRISVDDELLVVGRGHRDSGTKVRVRALQSHNRPTTTASPGRRVAINLVGVHHHQMLRGDALIVDRQWAPTRTLDCSLSVLESLDHEVSRRGAYHAYLGSGEHKVALRVLGGQAIFPGDSGLVRLHLPVAVPLLPGDRFVLRETGRQETVGGGEVLDVAPVRPAARARPDRSVDRVVDERGFVDAALLERLTGERRAPTLGPWVVSPGALARVEEEVRRDLSGAGPFGLDLAAWDARHRAVADRLEDVIIEGDRARLAGAGPSAEGALASHPYLAALEASPFQPPAPDGVDRGELRELVRRGLVVERDGCYFAPSAVNQATSVVAGLLAERPDGVTASEVREALGTTRKYLLPLLAHLDATGVTRRRGDLRVAGPRLSRQG
jgi:selenocysteine-specific elongation factor